MKLRGKNALLTGGSGGLGPYIGRALAREGVNFALAARRAEPIEAAAGRLRELGVRAVAIPANVADPAHRERLVERATAELGQIDILVNNAAIEWTAHYTSLSPESIEEMIQTNITAPLVLARLVLPAMIERGSGHVVTVSSLSGKKGSPYVATYAATKIALDAWTSGVRAELRGTGVSASVVCPGFVADTGMFATYRERAPRIAGETSPEKVAAAVTRSIRDDVHEIIVSPGPARALLIANAVSPELASWVLRAAGVHDFFRRQAKKNEAPF
jgi:short-subunit dehydrogenase